MTGAYLCLVSLVVLGSCSGCVTYFAHHDLCHGGAQMRHVREVVACAVEPTRSGPKRVRVRVTTDDGMSFDIENRPDEPEPIAREPIVREVSGEPFEPGSVPLVAQRLAEDAARVHPVLSSAMVAPTTVSLETIESHTGVIVVHTDGDGIAFRPPSEKYQRSVFAAISLTLPWRQTKTSECVLFWSVVLPFTLAANALLSPIELPLLIVFLIHPPFI